MTFDQLYSLVEEGDKSDPFGTDAVLRQMDARIAAWNALRAYKSGQMSHQEWADYTADLMLRSYSDPSAKETLETIERERAKVFAKDQEDFRKLMKSEEEAERKYNQWQQMMARAGIKFDNRTPEEKWRQDHQPHIDKMRYDKQREEWEKQSEGDDWPHGPQWQPRQKHVIPPNTIPRRNNK